MTYDQLLKLAREGKTIWVTVKNFKVAHQVSGFSNVEYCVNGGFYRYDADKFDLLSGEIDPNSRAVRIESAVNRFAEVYYGPSTTAEKGAWDDLKHQLETP